MQEGVCLRQARTFEERLAAARLCGEMLGLTMPVLVDNMDNAANAVFAAWPERIYIIGADGRIAYKSGAGPYHFDIAEAAAALTRLTIA